MEVHSDHRSFRLQQKGLHFQTFWVPARLPSHLVQLERHEGPLSLYRGWKYVQLLERKQVIHFRWHAAPSVGQRNRPDTLLPICRHRSPDPVPCFHARRSFGGSISDTELQIHLLQQLEDSRTLIDGLRKKTGHPDTEHQTKSKLAYARIAQSPKKLASQPSTQQKRDGQEHCRGGERTGYGARHGQHCQPNYRNRRNENGQIGARDGNGVRPRKQIENDRWCPNARGTQERTDNTAKCKRRYNTRCPMVAKPEQQHRTE